MYKAENVNFHWLIGCVNLNLLLNVSFDPYLISQFFYFRWQFLTLNFTLPFCRFLTFNDLQQMNMFLFEFLFLQQQFIEATHKMEYKTA